MARVAPFDAHVAELLRSVNGELVHVFFSARGTHNPPVRPLRSTQRADQRAFPSVALRPQRAHLRLAATEWTNGRRAVRRRPLRVIRKIFGVWLQEHP